MTGVMTGAYDALDREEMDPGVQALLDRKAAKVAEHVAYTPLTTDQVAESLGRFMAAERPGATVAEVARMGGGASKEQFRFTLDGTPHILRMDPIETAAETDRRREFEVLNAYGDHVLAPRAGCLDEDGSRLGQSAVIMGFAPGVTKPTAEVTGPNVTGLGTSFPEELRRALAPQYVRALAALHAVVELLAAEGTDGTDVCVAGSPRAVLAAEHAQSLRDRSFHAAFGYEDGSVEIAPLDRMMSEFRTALPAKEETPA
ncbi:MAG TPA: phosphotransferase [Amycolatopsis sp.]|nr:phosphotransferase [Amycolatopsis sp.]